MDNPYVIEMLVRERLADIERWAERESRRAAFRPPRRPLRAAVGGALIRLGSAMLAGVEAEPGRLLEGQGAPATR